MKEPQIPPLPTRWELREMAICVAFTVLVMSALVCVAAIPVFTAAHYDDPDWMWKCLLTAMCGEASIWLAGKVANLPR